MCSLQNPIIFQDYSIKIWTERPTCGLPDLRKLPAPACERRVLQLCSVSMAFILVRIGWLLSFLCSSPAVSIQEDHWSWSRNNLGSLTLATYQLCSEEGVNKMISVVPEALLLMHSSSMVPARLRQFCFTMEQLQLSKRMTNTQGEQLRNIFPDVAKYHKLKIKIVQNLFRFVSFPLHKWVHLYCIHF